MNAPIRAPGNGACRLRHARLPMLVATILFTHTVSATEPGADDAVTFLMCLTYIRPLSRKTPLLWPDTEGTLLVSVSPEAPDRSRVSPRFRSSTTQMIASLNR